jgi:hypothetical protein
MHVPFWLARGPAALFERLPPALLTRDQLRMLEGPDNVVGDGGASMRRLGLGELSRWTSNCVRGAAQSTRMDAAVADPEAARGARVAVANRTERGRLGGPAVAVPALDLVEALPA